MRQFSTEAQYWEYLAGLRWKSGYVCTKCGCRHAYRLANGRYQCVKCRHQVSVIAGTVLHKTHMPLTQWFLTFYFVCQEKRGISAVQLAAMIGTTYKTAWLMLKRIRTAMGQRDKIHHLHGVIEFDDAYFGGPTVGKKRGWGTEKAKVFVALSLNGQGNPQRRLSQLYPRAGRLHSRAQILRSKFWPSPLAAHRHQQRQGIYSGHLSCMACPRRTFNRVWMSIPSASAAAASGSLSGTSVPVYSPLPLG